jgi:hypothetical protein
MSWQCSDAADVLHRVEAALGSPLDAPYKWHVVRNVAPDKYHVCISFRVPEAVAFAESTMIATASGHPVATERGSITSGPECVEFGNSSAVISAACKSSHLAVGSPHQISAPAAVSQSEGGGVSTRARKEGTSPRGKADAVPRGGGLDIKVDAGRHADNCGGAISISDANGSGSKRMVDMMAAAPRPAAKRRHEAEPEGFAVVR